MKKTLLTLIAASAVILSFVGCKPATKDAIDNDSGSWKGQVSERLGEGDSNRMSVTMKVTKPGYAPVTTDESKVNDEWFLWTDTKGIVLTTQPQVEKTTEGYKFKFTEAILNLVDYNNSPSTEEFVLYTCINGTGKKGKTDVNLKAYDVRGRICVYKDRKVEFESHKYYEVIEQVGVVSIINDEPQNTTDPKSLFKDGNYIITEIWPLDPTTENDNKIGGTYKVSDTMVFKGLTVSSTSTAYVGSTKHENVKNTIAFPVKASKEGETGQIIGLYQPERDHIPTSNVTKSDTSQCPDESTITATNYSNGKSRAELYGITGKTGEALQKAYIDKNLETIFAKEIKVNAHNVSQASPIPSTPEKSSTFGAYWFNHKNCTRWKAVYNDYVTEVELIEAPMEK